MAYESAKNLVLHRDNPDRVVELYDELMSFPARESYSISVACELLPLVEGIERSLREQLGKAGALSAAERVMSDLIRCVDAHRYPLGRSGDKQRYYMLLSEYLRGESSPGVLEYASEHRWGVLRSEIRELLERSVRVELSVSDVSVSSEEQLAPVVQRLQREYRGDRRRSGRGKGCGEGVWRFG